MVNDETRNYGSVVADIGVYGIPNYNTVPYEGARRCTVLGNARGHKSHRSAVMRTTAYMHIVYGAFSAI